MHLRGQGLAVKARAPRQKMLVRARLKAADGWHDACIVDVSRRGAGLQAAKPPPRGSYVEIRRGTHVIIAQVVWRSGHRFGVCAQDDVVIDPVRSNQPTCPTDRATGRPFERRRAPRSTQERVDSSRLLGRRMQTLAAAMAGIGFALIAVEGAYRALAFPLGQISAALSFR